MMLERLFDTPEKKAKLARYAWLLSLLMLALGYLFIALFWDY